MTIEVPVPGTDNKPGGGQSPKTFAAAVPNTESSQETQPDTNPNCCGQEVIFPIQYAAVIPFTR